ncbi:sad1 unc domain protein [Diplodia corticola]|uniref:Sad1 unc domain protein n=1 Tax=Diplodia corticola TaxID=236234 RepID=A0A1J9RFF5_9PEZI|nr:sad1 unc domain protein [Diplodia corticola]OJD38818.1 sad1 unc domain protein [Diplodia corticola]
MCKLGRHVFLAAVLLHTVAFADITTESAALPFDAHSPISSLPSISTCRSREINYITHTLPQQCLKSRPPPPAAATAANDTVSGESAPSAPVAAPTGGDAAGHGENEIVSSSTIGAQSPHSSSTTGETSDTGSQSAAGTAQPSAEPVRTDDQKTGAPEAEAEAEGDSPLDNAHFLSFEEWKMQNLAKAGQSPENVGQGRGTAGTQGRKPRPVNINNELDFLGEDAEIELDFGFGNKADRTAAVSASGQQRAAETAEGGAAGELSHRPRSKDAGKTCKERFNYASFDCAATVLKTNRQCKSSSSLLVENKDSYMLNECGAENKFVIVELCDDILVDTVVLANFEFFSSMFRTFRVSVSDRYPVKLERWKELGTFEARNSRDIQAFLVENPLIWARYLRIEFLTHFGNEFYCPVSLLRVHGTTMMEEFRHQEEAARGEEDLDEVMESESQALPAIPPNAQEQAPVEIPAAEPPKEAEPAAPSDAPSGGAEDSIQSETANQAVDGSSTAENRPTPKDSATSINVGVPDGSTSQTNLQPVSSVTPPDHPDSAVQPSSNVTQASHNQTDVEQPQHASASTDGPQVEAGHSVGSSQNATTASTNASYDGDQKSPPPPKDASNVAVDGTSTRSIQSGEGAKNSATQPPNATPTTQESFFKSIHKRLQMLESNSTLSLQYIEDQSRILRDAFSKVEKRQLGKTEKFLDQLNSTVMAELREFRQQYDQLWQSTVIELENRREQHQREMLAISTRLTLLADELVFQKRMAVVQSTLILLCLGLVLFVRSGASYLELPLVQQMMQKSQTALRLQFDSPASSPPPNYRRHGHSSSTEERKRFRFFGSSSGNLSDASTDGPRSPALEFSPPTPTSDTEGEMMASEQSPEPLRKTHSSPSTPRGFRDGSKLSWERASEAKVLGVGDGQTLMRRRSPLRREESVGDMYEASQTEQKGSGKAGGADPNQPGDSGGSASDSDDCLGYI